MKSMRVIISASLLFIAIAAGCSKDNLSDDCLGLTWSETDVRAGDSGTISLKLASSSIGGDSKSRFPGEPESVISGISVAVYRNGGDDGVWSLLTSRFFRSLEDVQGFEFKLNCAYRYRIFAVSNLWTGPGMSEEDFYSFPADLSELTGRAFVLGDGDNMKFSDAGRLGIPASGSSGELTLTAGRKVECNLAMTMLFSKIVFNVDRQGYTGDLADPTKYFSDFRIIVSHLNANLYPFPSEDAPREFSDCGETEYEMTCSGSLRSNSYIFYVPANTHETDKSRCKKNFLFSAVSGGEPEDDVESELTKLTFRGEFLPESGYSGMADYSIYPGGNLSPYQIDTQWYRDFDLKPGCQYTISLYFELSTLLHHPMPCWQLDILDFEDCRYFGLRWAQSRAGGAQYLIRGSWNGDNTIDGDVVQIVVARPGAPAELGIWYSTGGRDGSKFNEYDLPESSRNPGCPVLGKTISEQNRLTDNTFYLSMIERNSLKRYVYAVTARLGLPDGITVSFDRENGKITIGSSAIAAGMEFDCALCFLPGNNEIPFTLRCGEELSISEDFQELYVGQKAGIRIDGANGRYSVSCDTPGVLKLSGGKDDAYLGSESREVDCGIELYAWNHTPFGAGGREDRAAYRKLALVFTPADTLNDVRFTKEFPVYLPGIRSCTDDVRLTIDGKGIFGPMRYVTLDGAEMSLSDFDETLFHETVIPEARLERHGGQALHACADCVSPESGGLLWYAGTARGFDAGYSSGGCLDTGYDALVSPPEKLYGRLGPFRAKLQFAVPRISDIWKKSRDTTKFYDSVTPSGRISNTLPECEDYGNRMEMSGTGNFSSGIGIDRQSGVLEWYFSDSGVNVASLNNAPYGRQGVLFEVKNIRDGSVWSKNPTFLLYHEFTVNVCAYFAVEDKAAQPGYTSRFNMSGVFLVTPRHWAVMKKTWLNTSDYWKKNLMIPGNVTAAGVNLTSFVMLYTSWMNSSDCYHEGSPERCYWKTNTSYYNPQQGYLYVGSLGRDDIWGWRDAGNRTERYRYYFGQYYTAENVCDLKPVSDAYYYDGMNKLSYDQYIQRVNNEYVVINGKSGNVFENTFTIWLGERSR